MRSERRRSGYVEAMVGGEAWCVLSYSENVDRAEPRCGEATCELVGKERRDGTQHLHSLSRLCYSRHSRSHVKSCTGYHC
jgi:hypothetical protein